MTNTDKDAWTLWWIITIFIFVATIAFYISSHTKKIELTLVKGEKVDAKLFRLSSHNISMKMLFSKRNAKKRLELGKWQTVGDWKETGMYEFTNPGEPIKLLLKNQNQELIYEALPASSSNIRELMLYREDNNSFQFPLIHRIEKRFLIDSGFSDFSITILEVGKSFEGEKVLLYINPPLGFKTAVNNLLYSFLWFFYLWPIYVFILFIWFLILIFKKDTPS